MISFVISLPVLIVVLLLPTPSFTFNAPSTQTARRRMLRSPLVLESTPTDSPDTDARYLSLALEQARTPPFGSTYPNPPVGCVIVSPDTDTILGTGHHPVAGWPHAEVFALFEVAGCVKSGESAAVDVASNKPNQIVTDLLTEYQEQGSNMFTDCAKDATAYVTLEPCCHYGRTPPCAASLLQAGVKRVVVGCRDPNPKVDGGGFKLLTDAGVEVEIYDDPGCADVASNFLSRMNYIVAGQKSQSPPSEMGETLKTARAMAGELKRTNEIKTLSLAKGKIYGPKFLEELDKLLWKNDFVVVRDAGIKNKEAKEFGRKIVEEMVGVRVVQCVGHTITLYRPKQTQ